MPCTGPWPDANILAVVSSVPPPAIDVAVGSEEADARAAQAASQIFSLLLKGIKNIGIYRHAESRFAEYIEPAFNTLTAFLEQEHILPLKLGPYSLEYKKHTIYEEQSKENLTYKFYRDGMRFLMFREGLTAEELLRFVLLAIDAQSEAALFHEDMITRLWKENFVGIEYVVVEGFEFGDISPEEVEIEVEKIVSYLRNQLAANNDDITRFARLDIEDLQLELNDIDQVRGGIISGRTAGPDDRQWVQDEIIMEEKKRLFAKMVLILFQILERDFNSTDLSSMVESFSQILDSLLVSEDIRGAVAVVARFDRITGGGTLQDEHRQLVEQVRDIFAHKMVEPERLQSVGQYLALSKNLDELAVRAYLGVATAEQIPVMLDMLDTMERAEGRRILIEVMAQIGAPKLNLFVERLTHKSSNVVKDMLAIIDGIDPPNKIDLYAKTLEHPNIMIRLEALKVIARAPGDRAIKHLEKAAQDEDLQLRLQALRAMAVRDPARAVPVLKRLMSAGDYASKDKREQLAIAIAMGECRSKEALEFFASTFETKAGLFTRGKSNDLKLMAIKGLQAMKSVEAFNVLAKELQNRAHGKEVLESVHKAALRMKAELTGEAPPPEAAEQPEH